MKKMWRKKGETEEEQIPAVIKDLLQRYKQVFVVPSCLPHLEATTTPLCSRKEFHLLVYGLTNILR